MFRSRFVNDHRKARLLWMLTAGYRTMFSGAIAAMAVGYVFMFGVPMVAKFSIDAILAEELVVPAWIERLGTLISSDSTVGMFEYLSLAAVATVGLTVLMGIFIYIRDRLIAVASEGVIQRLRNQIFDHLEHLPSRYHDQADTGDLVQRCTSDMETLRVFLAGQVIEISRALLMLIVVLPILFSLDTNMAWLSMASMPLLLIVAVVFFQKVKSLFLEVDESEARMTTVLQENLTGIRVVRAFARQPFETSKFAEKNADFRNQNTRLIKLLGLYYGFSDLVCLGQIGLLLLIGSHWVIEGALTIGTLFAFLTYESMIIWPIRHMGRVLTDSGKAVVSMGRLAEILLEPIESRHEKFPPMPLRGNIEIKHLQFAYEKGKPILKDFSLSIGKGQTLAILGPPGSGKSTLMQVLMRLYDYKEGSIKLDGSELSSLARKYVRGQVSIVLQEPFLYSASILDNLKTGKPHATLDEVRLAARSACIDESIQQFPRGYNSMVGERGVTLSGGQRQRLALARALLKRPPVLILDDALSAVDTDTETRILSALKSSSVEQTRIIIAHRLSTVMHADKIAVLHKGRVVQAGNHESLSREEGNYRQLCEIQGAIQQQIEGDLDEPSLYVPGAREASREKTARKSNLVREPNE
ncbi:MAG TPA: ABC transporter ATP-binding protein [Gammaproteobacteria bacterium]|nr:ABC transporter ATP-binding protein [Gammaproteobacteria bacterium]